MSVSFATSTAFPYLSGSKAAWTEPESLIPAEITRVNSGADVFQCRKHGGSVSVEMMCGTRIRLTLILRASKRICDLANWLFLFSKICVMDALISDDYASGQRLFHFYCVLKAVSASMF